jgi:hypothetical protein
MRDNSFCCKQGLPGLLPPAEPAVDESVARTEHSIEDPDRQTPTAAATMTGQAEEAGPSCNIGPDAEADGSAPTRQLDQPQTAAAVEIMDGDTDMETLHQTSDEHAASIAGPADEPAQQDATAAMRDAGPDLAATDAGGVSPTSDRQHASLREAIADAALIQAAATQRVLWARVKGFPYWPVGDGFQDDPSLCMHGCMHLKHCLS